MPRPSTISRCASRLAELEARAARHHLAAVLDELLQRLLEVRTCGWPLTIARLMTPNVALERVSL
jgi:hypothetical protein